MTNKVATTSWQNFKRLMSYTKMYKKAGIFAIFFMLGYASIDVYFLSKLPALIDEGLTGKNPDFMKWTPLFVIVCFTIRGICHFLSNYCLNLEKPFILNRIKNFLTETKRQN